jgi:succinyl-CoA synthetase alpha subunit
MLFSLPRRGVYKAGTEPKVFINKHTKVICQGMTGKHGTFHTQ